MSSPPRSVQEFARLTEGKVKRVFVAQGPLNLSKLDKPVDVYVLEMGEVPKAADRGGFWSGRTTKSQVRRAFEYRCGNGVCVKVAEYDDAENLESLELPAESASFSIVMPDGSNRAVQGVVDEDLAHSYHEDLSA